ncbi:MAG: DoxX family protein [Cytophagaceae bacterium]|nr:DoxX family protein [Gemmatimonadaceae bacterium]
MRSLATSPAIRVDAGLALLRVATGVIFAAHGAQKLFVYGFGGVTGAFAGMGVPLPGITGPLVALLEFFGGLAIVAGLLTRLAGVGLSITMLGAIGLVHLGAGFFNPNGVEFPLALFSASAALALTGAGRYSLDALLFRGRSEPISAQPAPTIRKAA